MSPDIHKAMREGSTHGVIIESRESCQLHEDRIHLIQQSTRISVFHPADSFDHLFKIHQSTPGIVTQKVRGCPCVSHDGIDQLTQSADGSPHEHQLMDLGGGILEIQLISSKL